MPYTKSFNFAFLALAIAGPALGQDGSEVASNRTPVNAQKFIIATPPQFGSVESGDFIVDRVASPESCITIISGRVAKYDTGYVIEKPDNVREFIIDWTKVTELKSYLGKDLKKAFAPYDLVSSHDGVVIKIPSILGGWIDLKYDSLMSRDRVLAAAQYLMESCDSRKEFGF